MTWVDRATLPLAPKWTLRRIRARIAADMVLRHYESGATTRRTQGWRRPSSDGNAALAADITNIRNVARDLIRNNPWAASALNTIVDHTVGWGIAPAVKRAARGADTWKRWAETTACDADGRLDFAGLQKQVLRTVAESGECLVRRRWRRPEDNLPLPVQLQILEPDILDESKDGALPNSSGRIIQGIQFGPFGRREGYWLRPEHPGATGAIATFGQSRLVPAEEILHVFRSERAGQVRAVSWFHPVVLRLKDLDDYEDAALMKQKIAACLAVITSDADGSATALGGTDATQTPELDLLGPGIIHHAPPGRSVTVVQPPTVSEHGPYIVTVLRAIAAGLGITYEDMVGDFSQVNFSSARMGRLKHWARVEDWRWRMLIPQFCDPVWRWAAEAAQVMKAPFPELAGAGWTPPPLPFIEPDKEGLAMIRNIRGGFQTLSESIRERGYDPETLLAELADDWKLADRLGLILDSDPRKTTQAGQIQGVAEPKPAAPAAPAPAGAPSPNGNGNGARNGHVEDRPAPAAEVLSLKRDVAELRSLVIRQAMEPAPAPNVHVDIQQAPAPPTVTVIRAPALPPPEELRGPVAATDAE